MILSCSTLIYPNHEGEAYINLEITNESGFQPMVLGPPWGPQGAPNGSAGKPRTAEQQQPVTFQRTKQTGPDMAANNPLY